MTDTNPTQAVFPNPFAVMTDAQKQLFSDTMNEHRSTDERDEYNHPTCSCDHSLGMTEVLGEHQLVMLEEAFSKAATTPSE